MQFNKALFKFIKVAFSIMIILLVVYGAVRVSKIGYDFGYRVFTEPAMDEAPGKEVTVQVDDDMSGKKLGEELEAKGLIRDANLFQIQLKLSAYSDRIKAGVYTLSTSMTPKEMIVVMAAEDEEDEETTESGTEVEESTEGLAPMDTEAEADTESEVEQ